MPLERISLVGHTHWDREWYEPFEVMRAHLVTMLDQALPVLERDGRHVFSLDGHVAPIDDYLALRPDAEPRIRALVSAGRLRIGPLYTQADTLLVEGEAVIRNLAAGIRRAGQLGGHVALGYMPDQFGHAAQVPQILRLFGIPGAALWRGVGAERPPPAFRWVSPDGSAVTALWLHEGYGSGRRLPSDPAGFADAIERMVERMGDWLGPALLVPVGDDHTGLPLWLPDAAEELQRRHPRVRVVVGGYGDHLPPPAAAPHEVRGELRSPAFAPVLAGVASARIREKQASQHATTLLLRYAEPLSAWAALCGAAPRQELIDRAWHQLFLNQAHDSIAGCGVDAAHQDVAGRYRRAEQLGEVVRSEAFAALRVKTPAEVGEHGAGALVFHPGPRAPSLIVEIDIPKAMAAPVCAIGPDGIPRPVQMIGQGIGQGSGPTGGPDQGSDEPLFEGEFSAAELSMYLGGLDPQTPLFGKYLGRIAAHSEGPGRVRLDIGLSAAPAPAARLLEDQRQVMALLPFTERFRIVLHGGDPTRRALVEVGPAPEMGLVPVTIRSGAPAAELPRAGRYAADGPHGHPQGPGAQLAPVIASGSLRVAVEPAGTVLITDEALGLSLRANDLIDEGDRGDLYHFDPAAGPPHRPRLLRAYVAEEGPLRARLRIEQEFDLPAGLLDDRSARGGALRPMLVTTEISLLAGQRRVEFATTLTNEVNDHRLRALTHLPFRAEHLDVEHGLSVVARPLDPASLGAGVELPAATGQHHGFCDVRGGRLGVALLSRGLPEHEVMPAPDGSVLALTLLRAVGWLARGDLRCVSHAVGPMLHTPGAQEHGPHRFEYALLLHVGDWEEGGVMADARRYAAPPLAIKRERDGAAAQDGTGGNGTAASPGVAAASVPAARPLVELSPAAVVLSAVYPSRDGRGVVVRVVNAGPRAVLAGLRLAVPVRAVIEVDPLEAQVAGSALSHDDGVARLPLRPWQIATLLFLTAA